MTKQKLGLVFTCFLAGLLHAANPTDPTPLVTKSADQLIAVLRTDAGRKEKADACRELAVVGGSSAVPVLASLLNDEQLSHMALYALETIPGSSVDAALRAQLPKLNGRPLIGVIGSLGVRRDAKAVKPLTGLLKSYDPLVAQASARALGKIANSAATKALLAALPTIAPTNRLAFIEAGLQCAERLQAEGNSRKAVVLYDQIDSLPDLPAQARMAACRGAILARGSKDLGMLSRSLVGADPVVFDAAVRVSMEMPTHEVTGVLVANLTQPSAGRQMVVIQALGERGDGGALSSLQGLAKSGEMDVRLAAIRSLAMIGNSGSVQVLLDLLLVADPQVTAAAKDGLAGIPGIQADAAVLNMLNSGESSRQFIGIELAMRRGLQSAVRPLIKILPASDPKVRLAALQGVGDLGSVSEVPVLLQFLLHANAEPDINGAAEALKALCARIGKPDSATDQIVTALYQAQAAQKKALFIVLASIGGVKALAAVRAALHDANAETQDAAIRTLADWADPAAAPDLLEIARSSTNSAQRVLALRGYVRLASEGGGSPVEKLRMLSEAATLASNSEDKKLLLSALGDVTTTESLRQVSAYLADAQVAEEAGAAAVKIAAKLDAKEKTAIAQSLNQVLKTVKSESVLTQARKRLEALGVQPEPNGS
jgi:HEAT repeat protein